jgi:hypothetical protein
VEIGDRDRCGDRESDDPANERATAILGREPPQVGQGDNGAPDSMMPPTTAPLKSPAFPAALPRMEPMTAPRPAKPQAVRNAGMGFKEPVYRPPLGCFIRRGSNHSRVQAELPGDGKRRLVAPGGAVEGETGRQLQALVSLHPASRAV